MLRRVLAASVLVLLAGSAPVAVPPQSGNVRVIEVSAERFEFWPSQIVVDEGEQVEFRIRSEDTLHGFRIAGGGVNLLVPKRGKGAATARFTGTRPGRYTFECTRMCGAGHHFMRGVLIVRPASEAVQP